MADTKGAIQEVQARVDDRKARILSGIREIREQLIEVKINNGRGYRPACNDGRCTLCYCGYSGLRQQPPRCITHENETIQPSHERPAV